MKASPTETGALITRLAPLSRSALVVLLLSFCLFAESSPVSKTSPFRSLLGELASAVSDPTTQWMMMGSASVYFLVFATLRWRVGAHNEQPGPENRGNKTSLLLLTALVGGAGVGYIFRYAHAATSTQTLTFVGAATLGLAATVWEGRRAAVAKGNDPDLTIATPVCLVVLLSIAAVLSWNTGSAFSYRSEIRWTGAWDNPNLAGALMALGSVLALGLAFRSTSLQIQRGAISEGQVGAQRPPAGAWRLASLAFYMGAAVVTGMGLIASYSRGAWVALVATLVYLAYNAMCRCRGLSFYAAAAHARRCIKWWCVLIVSVFVVCFWKAGTAESHVSRRVVSMGNVNDFSWRNRIAAWEGTLQMMSERPWFGYGWNKSERVYDRHFRAANCRKAWRSR